MDTYKAKIKATINGINNDVRLIPDRSYKFDYIIKDNNKIEFEISDDERLKCNNEYLELGVPCNINGYSVQYSTDDTYNKTPFSCLFDCFSQRIITFNVKLSMISS
jgi:hypothetical protein